MQIIVNDENEITSCITVGTAANGITVDDDLMPETWHNHFKPGEYIYADNAIVVNPNYTDQTNEPVSGPTLEMQAINVLGMQVAQLTAKVEAQAGGAN